MHLFRAPDYQSEVTQFLTHLKTQNPKLESAQLAGRSLLWDKTIDAVAQADSAQGRVAQKPYVYQTQNS